MKKIFTKIRHNGELKGFTLAEVLITLGIIGVIAALTMPALIQNHNDRAAVVKVKKMYSVIANAVHLWQVEEGCDTDVADCLDKYDVVDCKNAFAGIESKLRIADRRYQNQPVANVNWLPETSRGLDGTQTYWAWSGLSKNSVNREMVCHYLFHDGTTMMVHMPDTYKNSFYMYFDINGKRMPNRIGKDIFLIGVGSNADGKPFKSVNPYVWQDNNDSNGSYGICRYVADRTCNADDGKSPTAYVLAHDKLPDLKAMGYPK